MRVRQTIVALPERPDAMSRPFPSIVRNHSAAAPLLLAAALFAVSPAAAQTLDVDYRITLAGLTIGNATLQAMSQGDRYGVEVNAQLTGVVGMLSGGRGAARSSGSLNGSRPVPSTYAVTSSNGRQSRSIRMALVGGDVRVSAIDPPLEEAPDRVPVSETHRRGIVDPVSALLMPMAGTGGGNPCARTIPVFDGAARFDIALSRVGEETVSVNGFQGVAAVCAARYVPISGHRTDRPGARFMADNRDLKVWLAPVEGSRLYAPVRISVRTMIGTTVIDATRFAAAPAATSSVRGDSNARGSKAR